MCLAMVYTDKVEPENLVLSNVQRIDCKDGMVYLTDLLDRQVVVDEIGLVPVEPICDEDWDIILPGIPGGSGEQDPFIHLGDFQECFCPSPVTDDTLLVKYKETVFYIFVLADVVP